MPEIQAILTRAVCEWAGVPLANGELTQRRDQLAAMIDGAGGVGARHWHARKARKEAESWMIGLIQSGTRRSATGRREPAAGSGCSARGA